MPAFEDAPGLARTAFGEAMYARGRELVSRGILPAHLLWDADEVLWDWALSGVRLFSRLPLALFGNLGHREYIAVRPGLLELLWGMHHEALARGEDPYLRIWTSGYPWRLWRILREVEGFDALLGPPFSREEGGAAIISNHPRVFTRPDYVRVMLRLLNHETRAAQLAPLSPAARATIERQLVHGVDDSGFKIPELAILDGKVAFAPARFLIDDARRNVEWFKDAGRSAVHVKSHAPRIFFGKIPNSTWTPIRFLETTPSTLIEAIATALLSLAEDAPTAPRRVAGAAPSEPSRAPQQPATRSLGPSSPSTQPEPPRRIFHVDIPSEVLWREWLHPMRELRRAQKRARALLSSPSDRTGTR